MKVTVRLFAELRERTGRSSVILDVPEGASGTELWRCLSQTCPALTTLGYRPLLAKNGHYVSWGEPFEEGDEAAFLAPVGGG
ncbi:MAG: MoaD/ThiS family protein [Acidobacteriota bacterium]